MAANSNSTGFEQANETCGKIRQWLMQERWSVRQEHAPEAIWVLVGEDPERRRVVVAQPAQIPEILIQATVHPDGNVKTRLAGMPANERDDFLWDMRFALLRMGVGLSGVQLPFDRIVITQVIHYDGLTQDALWQRVLQVRNAVAMIQWMVARKFAQPPPEPPRMGFPTA